MNLERTFVLLFYYFLCLKVNLDLEKTNQLGESSPNFIFAVVNLDPIILEKRWIDDESWPNDFDEKVNRGEDLRWVGSRCMHYRWRESLTPSPVGKDLQGRISVHLRCRNHNSFRLWEGFVCKDSCALHLQRKKAWYLPQVGKDL